MDPGLGPGKPRPVSARAPHDALSPNLIQPIVYMLLTHQGTYRSSNLPNTNSCVRPFKPTPYQFRLSDRMNSGVLPRTSRIDGDQRRRSARLRKRVRRRPVIDGGRDVVRCRDHFVLWPYAAHIAAARTRQCALHKNL